MLSSNYFSGVITTTPMDVIGPAATFGPPAPFLVGSGPVVAGGPITRLPPVTRNPRVEAGFVVSGPQVRHVEDLSVRRPMPEAGFVVSGPVAQRHLPDKESTLDLHRHRHDGTQPTREKASPSHKADIEWTIKH